VWERNTGHKPLIYHPPHEPPDGHIIVPIRHPYNVYLSHWKRQYEIKDESEARTLFFSYWEKLSAVMERREHTLFFVDRPHPSSGNGFDRFGHYISDQYVTLAHPDDDLKALANKWGYEA
jgi:hypothetical protein